MKLPQTTQFLNLRWLGYPGVQLTSMSSAPNCLERVNHFKSNSKHRRNIRIEIMQKEQEISLVAI